MVNNSVFEGLRDSTNYFVCTLGQAASVNSANPPRRSTINEFLDHQAENIPDKPAVGFTISSKGQPNSESWKYRVFTFDQLRQASDVIAHELSRTVLPLPQPSCNGEKEPLYHSKNVAMMCASGPDFLFLWLGLTRLGFATLQIAPQCSPAAIAHLCQTCDISVLFYDDSYKDVVLQASALDGPDFNADRRKYAIHPTPFAKREMSSFDLIDSFLAEMSRIPTYWPLSDEDVMFYHHSSGTSGMPKAVSRTHKDSIGPLPCLESDGSLPTFTTTPIYHGGMPDILQSWTSNALIWLFDGKSLPITAANIIKSVQTANAAADYGLPKIGYFSAVPLVIEMLGAEDEGIQLLQEMEVVGFGGASLPQTIGDDLVSKGINLVSRFGIVECGFLLSSHRDYSVDYEWQFLRTETGMEYLYFEDREDGKAELVILPGWPRMPKANRTNGSFATSDLFEPHPSIPNAWRYHSSTDTKLTLISGEKFDPTPFESELSSSELVADAFVFSQNRPYPGALLFPSEAGRHLSTNDLIDSVWPKIEKMNASSPPFARIFRKMLIVGCNDDLPLEKSSKGTLLRGQAEARFADQIAEAYEESKTDEAQANGQRLGVQVADGAVLDEVALIIQSILGRPSRLDQKVDLFDQGVDSVSSLQIRTMLQKLLPTSSFDLPMNVVYDCGTIEKLASYVLKVRNGNPVDMQNEKKRMFNLVKHYSAFRKGNDKSLQVKETSATLETESGKHVIVLTGSTGSLGAHILDLLRSMENVSKVYCLVRARSTHAAVQRVSKSLVQRGKVGLDPSEGSCKISCCKAKLGETNLGLTPEVYRKLSSEATSIIHAAWMVNFSMKLDSFVKDHIAGIHNLINLSLASEKTCVPAVLFCSSTASVLGPREGLCIIPESPSRDPSDSSPLGYAQSKWVGEAICRAAHQKTKLKGRIHVLRIGQLCGDSKRGIWSVSEAWPLMLSSVNATGALPDLDEPLSWLPVDVAAQAVTEVLDNCTLSSPSPLATLEDEIEAEMPVYHILNPDKSRRWSDLLKWVRDLNSGSEGLGRQVPERIEIVSAQEWLSRLEKLADDEGVERHPALKLLGLWKDAYGSPGDKEEKEGEYEVKNEGERENVNGENKKRRKNAEISFEMHLTKKVAPILADVRPMSSEQFALMWRWIMKATSSSS